MKLKTFFKSMPSEAKKLTFPTAKKVGAELRTVLASCAIMAAVVAALDLVFISAFDAILSLF